MAKNQPQIDIGQGGAIFITTDAYTPPTGKVICAIQFLSNSKFTSLTPANDTNCRYLSVTSDGANANNNAGADGVGAKSFTAGGSGTEILFANNEFIYGRYSGVELQAGSAICYLADV
tara:strand:+ start:415 stop:768 length:354 start_codon:yes stop_codon:yes gene_type:complete